MTWTFDRYVVMMHKLDDPSKRDDPPKTYFAGVGRGEAVEDPALARIFYRKNDASKRANDLNETRAYLSNPRDWRGFKVSANVVKMQFTMSEVKE